MNSVIGITHSKRIENLSVLNGVSQIQGTVENLHSLEILLKIMPPAQKILLPQSANYKEILMQFAESLNMKNELWLEPTLDYDGKM
jgi:hypothetical protein